MKKRKLNRLQKFVEHLINDIAILGLSWIAIYLGCWILGPTGEVNDRWDLARAGWAGFGALITWLFSMTFSSDSNGKKWDGSEDDNDDLF